MAAGLFSIQLPLFMLYFWFLYTYFGGQNTGIPILHLASHAFTCAYSEPCL